jgi:hypothetical protein
MDYPQITHFEIIGVQVFYRPQGRMSPGELVDKITYALLRCRDFGIRQALVDVTGATGFESPGPAFRRWAVRRWARISASEISIALVAPQELICPQKTGLLVAAQEGLNAHICSCESEALEWFASGNLVKGGSD